MVSIGVFFGRILGRLTTTSTSCTPGQLAKVSGDEEEKE